MTQPAELDYGFHSDQDGDRFLHSDDPTSDRWTVEVVGRSYGDDSTRETAERYERRIGFPALNWHIPLSAWHVGRDHCHVEVVDAQRRRHLLTSTCPHAVATDAPPACAACGQPSDWLVALLYGAADTGQAGRLLPYCEQHRAEANPRVRGLTLPLSMFRLDPELLLLLMYRGGATLSDPTLVAEMLNLDPAGWLTDAQEIVDRATS